LGAVGFVLQKVIVIEQRPAVLLAREGLNLFLHDIEAALVKVNSRALMNQITQQR
jgi:hypothetical protein